MNSWIQFIKEYSKKNNISYGCAISDGKAKKQYQLEKIRKDKPKLQEKIRQDKQKLQEKIRQDKQKLQERIRRDRNELRRTMRNMIRGSKSKEQTYFNPEKEKSQSENEEKKLEKNRKKLNIKI